jgi:hypothetical protein
MRHHGDQLQDAHLRDGVVRNLPAGAARAALDPVVALAQAGLLVAGHHER